MRIVCKDRCLVLNVILECYDLFMRRSIVLVTVMLAMYILIFYIFQHHIYWVYANLNCRSNVDKIKNSLGENQGEAALEGYVSEIDYLSCMEVHGFK